MNDKHKFKVKAVRRCHRRATALEDTIEELRGLKNELRAEEKLMFNRLAKVCEYNSNTVCMNKGARVGVCMLDDCHLVWATN